MAPIADLSTLINKVSGGGGGTRETIFLFKTNRVAGATASVLVTGRLNSLWRMDGTPQGGDVPTSAAIPDNTTNGSLKQTSNTSGYEKFIYSYCMSSLNAASFILYDRLMHCGGLSGTVTTAQTVQGDPASPGLTRYNTNSTCVGNMIMVEIYTALGTTQRTITASYTNQAGTANQTTIATPIGSANFNNAYRAFFLPLADGDTGVQAVKDVTISASTGGPGNFGVSIVRPLAMIGTMETGGTGFRDFTVGLPGLPEVESGACLAMLVIPSNNANYECYGGLSLVES